MGSRGREGGRIAQALSAVGFVVLPSRTPNKSYLGLRRSEEREADASEAGITKGH